MGFQTSIMGGGGGGGSIWAFLGGREGIDDEGEGGEGMAQKKNSGFQIS